MLLQPHFCEEKIVNEKENKNIKDIKITGIKLKKDESRYLLDIGLDCEDIKVYIKDLLLCDIHDVLHEINIVTDRLGTFETSYVSGLFSDKLKLIGNCYIIQTAKEMTLEDIEKVLGYPVKIVKEKE